jgi:hypothetical protein
MSGFNPTGEYPFMNRLKIKAMTQGNFSIELKDHSDGIVAQFKGSVDIMNTQEVLVPFFKLIHDRMTQYQIRLLKIDLSGLLFMNSGGIKSLVHWINNLIKTPDEEKYSLTFITNYKTYKWQSTSIDLLQCMAPRYIRIEDHSQNA